MFVLYELMLVLGLIIALPWFLITGVLRGKYLQNFPERMGFYRMPAAAHDLWIHAVSVGETIAARPVVDEILRRRPGTSIVFTTTTITGQAQARRLFPRATIPYCPLALLCRSPPPAQALAPPLPAAPSRPAGAGERPDRATPLPCARPAPRAGQRAPLRPLVPALSRHARHRASRAAPLRAHPGARG